MVLAPGGMRGSARTWSSWVMVRSMRASSSATPARPAQGSGGTVPGGAADGSVDGGTEGSVDGGEAITVDVVAPEVPSDGWCPDAPRQPLRQAPATSTAAMIVFIS